MTQPQIAFLAEHPRWVDTLAAWHYREWGALYGDQWSLEQAREELQRHAHRQQWPTTLIALDAGGDLLGSVSLVESDAIELRVWGGPWLSSLYVRPAARRGGVGRALVRALQAMAVKQGVEGVWLFTPAHREYYLGLDWYWRGLAKVGGRLVDILHWRSEQ